MFKCFVRYFDIIQAALCSVPKIKLYLNVTLRRKGCLNRDSDWFRVVLFQIYCSLPADLPDTTVFSVINNQYWCACVGQNNTQIQSHDKEKTTITDRKVDTDCKLNHWYETTLAHCHYANSTFSFLSRLYCFIVNIKTNRQTRWSLVLLVGTTVCWQEVGFKDKASRNALKRFGWFDVKANDIEHKSFRNAQFNKFHFCIGNNNYL